MLPSTGDPFIGHVGRRVRGLGEIMQGGREGREEGKELKEGEGQWRTGRTTPAHPLRSGRFTVPGT